MIDLALALEKINPQFQYLLSQSIPPHSIIEWRSADPQPTEAALLAAWAQCSTLTANAQTVTANVNADVASVGLLIGDDQYTLPLTNGAGSVAISFPDGVVSRVVKFQNQAVYGYAEVTVNA